MSDCSNLITLSIMDKVEFKINRQDLIISAIMLNYAVIMIYKKI